MAGSVRIRRSPTFSRVPADAEAIVIHLNPEGIAIDALRREGSRTIARRLLDWSLVSESYAIKLARKLAKVLRIRTVYVVGRRTEARLLWSCSMRIVYEDQKPTCEAGEGTSLPTVHSLSRQSPAERRECEGSRSAALIRVRSRALPCKPAATD